MQRLVPYSVIDDRAPDLGSAPKAPLHPTVPAGPISPVTSALLAAMKANVRATLISTAVALATQARARKVAPFSVAVDTTVRLAVNDTLWPVIVHIYAALSTDSTTPGALFFGLSEAGVTVTDRAGAAHRMTENGNVTFVLNPGEELYMSHIESSAGTSANVRVSTAPVREFFDVLKVVLEKG